jgi:hypothetical protein
VIQLSRPIGWQYFSTVHKLFPRLRLAKYRDQTRLRVLDNTLDLVSQDFNP